ncbi:hypothetical protein MHC_02955 [Mycoplasma haemocanis str. Illinois]|uniref:Uncharacterized protein n=1 Tax=Mycoplasma haemocanis (strain Illinois) TaxID=1111676 RepID=H6N731_MYCHN|nr:hypothetical protein [Mycoplasma haemocanis]AEW45453.1 hypothetical protein MHC_02955 [Mycoplasma haemocanis str. Illinois]
MGKLFPLATVGGLGGMGLGGYGIYKMREKPETLKGLLKGVPLATNRESYKTTFEFSKKSDKDLMAMLKNKKDSISESSNHEEVAILMEEWCFENINKKVGTPNQDEILDKIKKWCIAKPETIEGMLEKPILRNGWEGKYDGIKDKEGVVNDIKTTEFTENDKSNKDKGGPALKKWCEEKLRSKTYEVGATELFQKVSDRCVSS